MSDSRHEILLDALLNGTTVDITPQSRAEEFLLALMNGVKDLPTPQSRLEAYYYALCQKGLGSGSGTGGGVQQVNEIIELVLANGNMVVTAPSGKAFKQVTVNKPENLVPENIAEGVNIAGVIGTHSGGGGEGVDYFAQRIDGTIKEYSNNNVTDIAEGAFARCYKLVSVNFPACLYIRSSAFVSCSSLTNINFPACTSLGDGAFSNCSLLTGVNFPACSVIAYSVFQNCKSLSNIDFPVCVELRSYAFQNCTSLTSANFPACSTIGGAAFSNCSALSSVNLPVCVIIRSYAFSNCSSLNSVNLPVCNSIGASAFQKCRMLDTFILGASSVCYLAASAVFNSTPIASGTGYIYVPASLVDAYKNATNWTYFSAQISAIEDMPA